MSHGVGWQLVTWVSGQQIRPIFKHQAVEEEDWEHVEVLIYIYMFSGISSNLLSHKGRKTNHDAGAWERKKKKNNRVRGDTRERVEKNG
jgi:hypothetical protein